MVNRVLPSLALKGLWLIGFCVSLREGSVVNRVLLFLALKGLWLIGAPQTAGLFPSLAG